MRKSRASLAGGAALAAVVVLLGWLWAGVGPATALYLSHPRAVGHAIVAWLRSSDGRHDIWVTLEEAGLGFLIAVAASTLLAVLLTRAGLLEEVFSPFIAVANAVPKIALAPLFLLLFGVGIKAKVYFVAAAIVFIPFYALYRAILSVRPVYLDHARVMGARRRQLIQDVMLPSVLAPFIASLRVTVAFALLSAIVAEFIAAQAGIGFRMVTAQQNSDPATLLAGVAIVAALAVILDVLLRLLVRGMAKRGIET